jgi:hypothetical protein
VTVLTTAYIEDRRWLIFVLVMALLEFELWHAVSCNWLMDP